MDFILGTNTSQDSESSRLAKTCEVILTYVFYAFWVDCFMFMLVPVFRPTSPEQFSSVLTGNFLGYGWSEYFPCAFGSIMATATFQMHAS